MIPEGKWRAPLLALCVSVCHFLRKKKTVQNLFLLTLNFFSLNINNTDGIL